MFLKHDGLGVDPHTLGGVVSFVDADETIGNLKHVVPQRDDDELGILCLFLCREEDEKGKMLVRDQDSGDLFFLNYTQSYSISDYYTNYHKVQEGRFTSKSKASSDTYPLSSCRDMGCKDVCLLLNIMHLCGNIHLLPNSNILSGIVTC